LRFVGANEGEGEGSLAPVSPQVADEIGRYVRAANRYMLSPAEMADDMIGAWPQHLSRAYGRQVCGCEKGGVVEMAAHCVTSPVAIITA
jgi:hypothetical protein